MSHANAAAGPKLILIIRHGEKPGNLSKDGNAGSGKHLSKKGFARAAAIPLLFAEPTY